jgi:hypothetical protein
MTCWPEHAVRAAAGDDVFDLQTAGGGDNGHGDPREQKKRSLAQHGAQRPVTCSGVWLATTMPALKIPSTNRLLLRQLRRPWLNASGPAFR